MKKFFCFQFLFCLIVVSPAVAQSDSTLSRHEIGMDFMPLFRREPLVNQPAGLLYRHYQENSAFRMRLQGGFSQGKVDRPGLQDHKSGVATIRAGKEWHKNFARMRFYYGLDARLNASYSYSKVIAPETDFEETSYSLGAGVLPLLGFYYKINRHFGISAETNSLLGYDRFWAKNENPGVYPNNFRRNNIEISLISEFALFLTYRF